MKTWLGIVGLAVLTAACSTEIDTSAAATNADTTPPAAWDADYEVMATRADAEAFIAQHMDDIFGDKPLPATDARTLRAQAALDKHWPAIVAKFHPGYPEPFVFVVDDDATVNAMAMFDWHTDRALNIIYVYSGLMKSSDADVETTLLHESGHLTMKNGITRYANALVKYYRADPSAEGVGLAMPNDPAAQAALAPYFDRAFTAGRFDAAELGGVPVDPMAGMTFFFDNYESAHASASNPDCAKLDSQVADVQKLLRAGTSPFDGSTHFAPEASAALTEASTLVEATALSCLKPPADIDFDAAFTHLTGAPAGSFAQARPEEVAMWQGKDALSGLFAIVSDMAAKQRAFESAPDFPQYRQYTGEEQADDFALTVMASEGADLGVMRQMFLDFTADEAYRAQCTAMLASAKAPPYNLVEPHHGNCYRAFHVGEFARYLASGGTGVVIPNIPPPPRSTAVVALEKPSFGRKPWKNSTQ